MLFFDLFHAHNYEQALDVSDLCILSLSVSFIKIKQVIFFQVMKNIGILPLETRDTVEQKVASFKQIADEVYLEDLLLIILLLPLYISFL